MTKSEKISDMKSAVETQEIVVFTLGWESSFSLPCFCDCGINAQYGVQVYTNGRVLGEQGPIFTADANPAVSLRLP